MLPAPEPQRESPASPDCPALLPEKENPASQLPPESSAPQLLSERECPAPPGRECPTPPGRECPALPGRECPAPPGRECPTPPGRECLAPPGRECPTPPRRECPAPPGRECPALPERECLMPPKRKCPTLPVRALPGLGQCFLKSARPPRSAQTNRLQPLELQTKDSSDLKSQMAQLLEYLVRQQAIDPAPAPALPLALVLEPTLPSLAVAPVVSERNGAKSVEEHFTISIEASWDGDLIGRAEPEVQEMTQEVGPTSEVASETDMAPPSSSV
ncbi:UNVERIFIED_CONTAM: hypothetical protein FKN15_018159 [Acipenser sinensis]